MSTYDLGDVARLAVQVTDSTGTLANATAVTLVVTLPDGTTSGSLTPTNVSTGVYQYDYTPTTYGAFPVKWTATGTNAGSYSDVFVVRDPNRVPLVGLATVKGWLKITTSTDDEKIRDVLDQATALVEAYTRTDFTRKTYTETHSSNGGADLCLYRSPIFSVTSVVVNGTTITDYTTDTNSGILTRGTTTYEGRWPWSRNGVVVEYVAGQSSHNPAILLAVQELSAHLWDRQQQGYRPGLGVMDGTEYATGSPWLLPRSVTQILDNLMGAGGVA